MLNGRPKLLMTATLLAGASILLGACATSGNFATLSSGACNAFPAPQYQIKGQTSYDQKWADETTEAGIAGCSWHRPKARPQSLNPAPSVPVKPASKATRLKGYFKKRFLSNHFQALARK